MTVFEYGLKHRMEIAWDLLKDDRRSIGQVAEAVGYDYASNFCSAFKRQFGLSPKVLRGPLNAARARLPSGLHRA